MRTEHALHVGDARDLALPDESVDLVVTSPPYPMIEMWDDVFAGLDPGIEEMLAAGEGERAFESMHAILDAVWDELERVLREGAIACINVGDATRTVENTFQTYPNHVRITEAFRDRGFVSLPGILWRKPTNSTAKFMGSGMVPTNAYPTLEHEHVLIFRKGGPRRFEPHLESRYESAYFWEERNRWFSDLWSDIKGVDQRLDGEARERSGAFPFELPYRLINMFSIHEDTVCDPFWGTGTTTLAAMVAGRESVGHELDPGLVEAFDGRLADLPAFSREVIENRLADHRAFVERVGAEELGYDAVHYEFPVRTKQERTLRLYAVETIEETDAGYEITHRPADAE
ncbi:DNA-methyltransferase [Halalkalicoccus jeotgali]|uniref:Type II methyltransferase n=1 Tax=Halalkalicoccus jeotgali (strain DSM 18796 / CECT 7217 / JCM 14584 / KCTC 4019 / B3) TaxID=795797 RepID=D8J8U1_HALJB|nr:site-specific DNA-methyltransferase [Halalkalicoccus jeotgali]ADJ14276.1 modification methylase [Halalkalicoccus jeotgali B3]ELY40538.1 modification methylase [Halalkalicoccus jeotgali B3]